MRKSFRSLVIGKGLLDNAAAKYLAENQPDIALIGPDEPTDYAQAHLFPATTMPPACSVSCFSRSGIPFEGYHCFPDAVPQGFLAHSSVQITQK